MALFVLLFCGCAADVSLYPPRATWAVGDAYVSDCAEAESTDCRETRGGHGSAPLFTAVSRIVDAAAGFFVRAGPPPEVNVTVAPEGVAAHEHRVGPPE